MKYVAILVLALAAAVSCRRSDVRVINVSVPQMRNQACAERIVRSLSNGQKSPGIDAGNIKVDLVNRKVAVPYESLTIAIKNIEFAIADAGFDAIAETTFPNKGVPANAEAKKALPPECTADTAGPGIKIELPATNAAK